MLRLSLYLLSIQLFTSHLIAQNQIPGTVTTSIEIIDNNISGGGFQSDVTITNDGMTVYSSADVSGIFKSTNGGLSYENINEGLSSPKVASLAITPDNDRILYVGTGDKGNTGGLYRSIDGGDTWEITMAGAQAKFAGNHSEQNGFLPDGHPRSNGDLIVVIEGLISEEYMDDTVIAGTYKDGVKIFSHGGNTLVGSVNNAGFVRSIAYDPSRKDTIYAAIQFTESLENGIYEIDIKNLSSKIVHQTKRPESLTVLSNGHAYAAIGKEGILKYDGNLPWELVNNGLCVDNENRPWTAVTGYVKGVKDVVYAGVTNAVVTEESTDYSSIWRTKDGGINWDPLVDAENNVSHKIHGQSYDWWYSTAAFKQAAIGRKNSIVSSIDVAIGSKPLAVTDDTIYVSGRGGIWKSETGGKYWFPAIHNMQATANNGVAVNPNDPTQVVLANTDYVVLTTGMRFEGSDITRDKPQYAASKGFDVVFDVRSEQLILGVGSRQPIDGGAVYVKPDKNVGITDSVWTDLEIDTATLSANIRVRAVCYGYHNGTSETTQIILAAVEGPGEGEGEGVYRFYNGKWTKSEGIKIKLTERSNFIWPDNDNSGFVYLLDLSTGFYRSSDGGLNWTNIWPDMEFKNRDFYNTGYIAADYKNPNIIYLSFQADDNPDIGNQLKIFRMTDAQTREYGSPGTAGITDISYHSDGLSIDRPGPIVIGPDSKLWLTQQQHSQQSIVSGLFVMHNPAIESSFTEIISEAYRNVVTQPSGIDVSTDGHIYISQSGNGLIKIKYTDMIEATANIELSASYIEIYPDPTSSIFTISGNLNLYNIEIIDANGSVFTSLDNNGSVVRFDINDLPIGTFLVRVSNQNNDQLCVEKIIKF